MMLSRRDGTGGFHPLYRGTWYLTTELIESLILAGKYVSIRYIAVLGI